MPLFSGEFAMDTENDMVEGYDEPIPVTIQMCPADAVSEKDVVVLEGVDCYERFFNLFEETRAKKAVCCVFNADHEWAGMERYVVGHYQWFEKLNPKDRVPPGCFHVTGDDRLIYKIEIVNRYGCHLVITDDWERSKKAMKDVAGDVYSEHPDWWPEGTTKDDVKLDIDESWYNCGWSRKDHPLHDVMMRYAIRDSFSQAMILRSNIMSGRVRYLTSSSAGMGECLIQTYGKKTKDLPHWRRLDFARKEFKKRFPPLNREMQDIVEDSLVGGFVYGCPGVTEGPLVHIDYKSSYPKHYSSEESFYGKVSVITPDNTHWEEIEENDKMFRWYLVSFDFDGLKPHGMPVFSGKECYWEGGRPVGCYNHKIRTGRIERKLFTEDYLEEIQYHVNVKNLVIHEMWFAKKQTGEFAEFINHEYAMKEICKANKENAQASIHKDNMNGGVHGKTITKTHRRSITYKNGVKEMEEVVNDPDYCSLIGFTGMMNRRCALVKACRTTLAHGFPVLMCDTDSIVAKATEADIRRVFGDLIAEELDVKKMLDDNVPREEIEEQIVSTLGKFELEKNKDTGRVEFDEFRCWGLKRYLELDNGQYRKSAFASMHRSVQKEVLMDFPVDGTVKSWTQKCSKKGKYTRLIVPVTKSARMEDIWYVPIEQRPKKQGGGMKCLKTEMKGYESPLDTDIEEEDEL